MTVEHLKTDGEFTLEGQSFHVTNNVWLVGDDDEVIVIDAAHDAARISEAVGGRRVPMIVCTHGHNDHINAAVDVADGTAVRLVHGEAGSETAYGDPRDAALAWQRDGAEWVHLVDLDAAVVLVALEHGRVERSVVRLADVDAGWVAGAVAAAVGSMVVFGRLQQRLLAAGGGRRHGNRPVSDVVG